MTVVLICAGGHLEIEDGVGTERRKFRLARIGHRLKRLVIVGSDGIFSLAAFRWLADQDASLVMLERNEFAKEAHPDIVTMGVRGRGSLDLAVFGSTTYRVKQLGPCPVLAVHI